MSDPVELACSEEYSSHGGGKRIPLQFRARNSSVFEVEKEKICGRDWMLHKITSLKCTVFILILVLVDISMLIYTEATMQTEDKEPQSIVILTLLIVSIFLVEIFLRIYAQGILFFYSAFQVIDAILVFASFVLVVLEYKHTKFVLVTRVIRFFRIFRVFSRVISHGESITMAFRHTVTMNKQRFQKDGYDLDLVYITPRIIAMSVPAQLFNGAPLRHRFECLYRNPVNEVARFFNHRHKGHYRIYNTCCERTYAFGKFNNNVKRIDIIDHSVPRLRSIFVFCKDLEQWMNRDKRNIFAVHCKGGKGRTGTLISSWLLYEYRGESADSALNYFANRRTDFSKGSKLQGVDTPSQSRYVRSFHSLLRKGIGYLDEAPPLQLSALKLESIGLNSSKENVTWSCIVKIYNENKPDDEIVFPAQQRRAAQKPKDKHETFEIGEEITVSPLENDVSFRCDDIVLHGDCHFKISYTFDKKKSPKIFCAFWIHSAFITLDRGDHVIGKFQLDKVFKDLRNEKCGPDFQVRLRFFDEEEEERKRTQV